MMPVSQQPGIWDGEETSSIAQRIDRYISVWMPARSYSVGTSVSLGAGPNDTLIVEENDLLCKVVKQRGGLPSGRSFRFKIDFDTGNFVPTDFFG
jgi:hypothetical protein